MKKIFINLSWTPLNNLHPILKNFYNKLEKFYKIEFINKWQEISISNVPKIYKLNWKKKILINIKIFLNSFLPRFFIVKENYPLILTANNFLLTKNDYYIITSSLLQFSWLKTAPLYNKIFKYFFKKFLLQKKLKKIYFYSHTSKQEFQKYCKEILNLNDLQFIDKLDIFYPELIDNKIVSESDIIKKFNSEKISFLFIARLFLTKGGYELIKALEIIAEKYPQYLNKITFNIIADIPKRYRNKLLGLKNRGLDIKLHWIDFTQPELERKFYTKNHVLLHLTRADMFWMVSLESKKNWLAVITTNQYLNPELFYKNEALFVKIKNKFKWNNWLPIIDYKSIWNKEENILDVNDIVNNIIETIQNKSKLLDIAKRNRNSLSRFSNKSKKMEELF